MRGEELRKILESDGKKLTELAASMGTSHQNLSRALNVDDVKTGLLEKFCKILKVDLTYFYGNTEYLPVVNTSGEQGTMVPEKLYKDVMRERDMYMLRLARYEEPSQILQKVAI